MMIGAAAFSPARFLESLRVRIDPAAAFRLALFLLIALHAAKVARVIPIQTFADGRPLVEFSHSATYGDIVRDRAFGGAGSAWGYDPYVGGGTPTGLGLNPPSTLPICFDRLVRRAVSADVGYKLFVALALLLGPLLLFAAARAFQMARAAALIAAAIASAGFMSHDQISRQFVHQGQISFWLGVFIAIFNAGCLYGWTLTPRRRFAAGFLASAIVLPAADPSLVVSQLLPWIALPLMGRGGMRGRAFLCVGIGLLCSFLANLSWLVPFIESRLTAAPPSGWVPTGVAGVARLWLPADGDWLSRLYTLTRAYLLVFALVGIFYSLRDKLRLSRLMWMWACVALVLGYFPLPALPASGDWGRFPFLLTTLLVLPASVFMSGAFLRPGTVRVLLFAWYLWFSLTWQLVDRYDPSPIRAELTPREHRLLRDLQKTPASGRILVQYGPLFTDGLRLASLERRHAFAGFSGQAWLAPAGTQAMFERVGEDWFIYGRPLRGLSEDALIEHFQRNGLDRVIVTTPVVRRFFAKLPRFEEVPSSGNGAYWIFRTKGKPVRRWLVSGRGRVSFDFNYIRIDDASAGRILTNFRWAPDLVASPGVRIRAVNLPSEMVPFIAVDNPVEGATVEIRLGR